LAAVQAVHDKVEVIFMVVMAVPVVVLLVIMEFKQEAELQTKDLMEDFLQLELVVQAAVVLLRRVLVTLATMDQTVVLVFLHQLLVLP
jgi:hypothetical protein